MKVASTFDGGGGAAIRIALAQHRIDRRSLDPVIAGADILLRIRRRVLRVVGHRVALALQFADRGHELRHGSGDIG
jgi:hypothetical protein